MSLQGIENVLRRLANYQIGDVPKQIEAGDTYYRIETLSMTSTFTDTEVDVRASNLVLLRTSGNSSTISYKIVNEDATITDTIQLDSLHQLVGFSRRLLISNSVAQSGLNLFIIKIQVPSTMVSAFASQRDLERFMQDLNADAITTPANESLPVANSARLFNADDTTPTFDRQRGNTETQLIATAARTATLDVAFTNFNGKYMDLMLDISAVTGTNPTLSVRTQVQDPDAVGPFFKNLLTPPDRTTTGEAHYQIGPGITDASSELTDKNDVALPRNLNMNVPIGGTDTPTFTYTVYMQLSV